MLPARTIPPIPGRTFPRQVAVFNERLIFTTLTPQDVASHTRNPFCHPDSGKPVSLFTLDDQLLYIPFASDHGPFNLAHVFAASVAIYDKIHSKSARFLPNCLYTAPEAKMKSNMLLIAALYFLIVGHCEPYQAFRPIAQFEAMPFRDAGNGPMDHGVSIQDCLYGMHKAIEHRMIDLTSFDTRLYQFFERVQNGDLNILGPFVPFASPVEDAWVTAMQIAVKAEKAGEPIPPYAFSPILSHSFKCVLKVFQQQDVGLVVRLNDELYDKRHFTSRGIDHVEMYFDDGTNPSDEIVREFIRLSEEFIEGRGKRVAVHCKAGLGRTGVLIGAYLIYKYQFSAQEAIGFMRIVRPGMVVGPQQQYMWNNQMKWAGWAAADAARREMMTQAVVPAEPTQLLTPPAETTEFMPTIKYPPTMTSALCDVNVTNKIPTILEPPRTLQAPRAKGGDAAGQPRKTMPRPTKLDIESTKLVPSSIPRASPSVSRTAPRLVPVESYRPAPPPTEAASRGVKRTFTRLPISSIPKSTSTSSMLAVPDSRLQRSSSASSLGSSVMSESEKPQRKRPAYTFGMTLAPTGLSSPPPSRENTPGDDVEMAPQAATPSRTTNKLRRRQPDSPAVGTPPPATSAASTPTSEKKSSIPVRKSVFSREKVAKALSAEENTPKRKGFSPPRITREMFRLGSVPN